MSKPLSLERLLCPAKLASFGNHLSFKNRMVLSPMTRSRANDKGVQPDFAAEYYSQRASAGLLITECTPVSAVGKGYCRMPGIYTEPQIQSWKKIVDKVRLTKTPFFMQLYHTGRIGHPLNRETTEPLVAPSALKPRGKMWTDQAGMQEFPTPRALETAEISKVIQEFATATKVAIDKVGFDGVELHAASGYLPHQFLSAHANQRKDQYGGSVENRLRFVVECIDAMVQAAGTGQKVGIKISPIMGFNDIDPEGEVEELYGKLMKALTLKGLAYVHLLQTKKMDALALVRKEYGGTVLAGGGFTAETGEEALQKGRADLIVYGSSFLANPDLPQRFKMGHPLNQPDQSTFYTPGPKGYTDYPFIKSQ